MKKILGFDLDDTLAVTKSPLPDEMAEILGKVLEKYEICIISGADFEQINKQVISRLKVKNHLLNCVHVMPTCGARYYKYDESSETWNMQYAKDLSQSEIEEISRVVEEEAKNAGIWPENPYGDVIENRGGQVTFAGLGTKAPAEEKYKWTNTFSAERELMRSKLAERLPGLEVRLGGTTSIDITKVGIDKAFGINQLIDVLDISKEEIVYFGDKMQEGGNDYPVRAMGVDCVEVDGWKTTKYALLGLLAVS